MFSWILPSGQTPFDLFLLDFIKTVLPTAAASSEFGALAAAISTSCSL